MDSESVQETLQNAGFTQYEADVYVALVERGSASAIEVADASGVPKSRVYDTLRDLEREGLVETYEQNSLRARALDPQATISDLRARAESFSETASHLEDLWDAPDLGEYDVTLVKRIDTVIEQAEQFIREATNEIQIAVTPEQLYELRPVLHEALSRDIVVKLSLSSFQEGDHPELDQQNFERFATEVRYREVVTPFVALVDRSKICFAPQPGSGHEFGIIADNRPLAYVFHWYYQTALWDPWELIYTSRETEPPITYTNIRQCIVDIAPLYHEEAEIHVTASGFDTTTGEEREISGRIAGLEYGGSTADNDYPSLPEVSGKVSIFLDDGSRVYSMGGWYAQLEDFELRRLTVDSIR